jgi:hypothetical protein
MVLMNRKPWSPAQSVIVAGLLSGLVAGWSGGCSKPDPTNVDVKKAKEALGKRWAGYGEIPRRPSPRGIAPVQTVRYWALEGTPR